MWSINRILTKVFFIFHARLTFSFFKIVLDGVNIFRWFYFLKKRILKFCKRKLKAKTYFVNVLQFETGQYHHPTNEEEEETTLLQLQTAYGDWTRRIDTVSFLSFPSSKFLRYSTILHLFRCRWRIFGQTFSIKSITWSDAAYTASILIKIHDFIASISIYIFLLCFTWLGLGDSFHASSVCEVIFHICDSFSFFLTKVDCGKFLYMVWEYRVCFCWLQISFPCDHNLVLEFYILLTDFHFLAQ